MWQYNYTIPSNELYHSRSYKYIRKEPNGKGGYRYYYKIKTGKHSSVIAEKVDGDNNSEYGTYVHRGNGNKEVYIKRRSKTLFGSSKSTTKMKDGSKLTIESDSLTKQAVHDTGNVINKGKTKAEALFKKLKKKVVSSKTVSTGKKKLQSILSKYKLW